MTEELAAVHARHPGHVPRRTAVGGGLALYPYVAFLFRVEQKRIPKLRAAELLTPELVAWKARIEALPYFARTYPPHWS